MMSRVEAAVDSMKISKVISCIMQEADKVHTSSGPSRNRVTSRPSSDCI